MFHRRDGISPWRVWWEWEGIPGRRMYKLKTRGGKIKAMQKTMSVSILLEKRIYKEMRNTFTRADKNQ